MPYLIDVKAKVRLRSGYSDANKDGQMMIIATNMNQIKARQLTLLMDMRWDGRKDTAVSN
jgi:hypothetical protein